MVQVIINPMNLIQSQVKECTPHSAKSMCYEIFPGIVDHMLIYCFVPSWVCTYIHRKGWRGVIQWSTEPVATVMQEINQKYVSVVGPLSLPLSLYFVWNSFVVVFSVCPYGVVLSTFVVTSSPFPWNTPTTFSTILSPFLSPFLSLPLHYSFILPINGWCDAHCDSVIIILAASQYFPLVYQLHFILSMFWDQWLYQKATQHQVLHVYSCTNVVHVALCLQVLVLW